MVMDTEDSNKYKIQRNTAVVAAEMERGASTS
jgi:hypothetical protein